jgi:hypothetical protein
MFYHGQPWRLLQVAEWVKWSVHGLGLASDSRPAYAGPDSRPADSRPADSATDSAISRTADAATAISPAPDAASADPRPGITDTSSSLQAILCDAILLWWL